MPDNRSFHEVATHNTGSLGSEISNLANEKSPKPAPVLRLDPCFANPPNSIATNDNLPASDARSFPTIPTHDTGGLGSKIIKSTNENCFKPAQSLENDAGSEYLLNTNYQGSRAYSAEVANGNPPVPDATLTPLES
ncbi:hypothetical protein DSO57_1014241 [Entomophthora muscae]|uniref:Uncharacterized protein n=1 Tax=Entomophthora muscae TaxID=34485 RepID=A0ACC2UG94_9FUNG|nr:hypothetical protein DSO57_1014241 [Entomophthora muscae]